MSITTYIVAFFLSLFSTTVMTYISMAAPIGPWIAPTLVLITLLLYKLLGRIVNTKAIACAVSAGSIGGILATAVGFYMPTLFFADKVLFNTWLTCPWYLAFVVSSVAGIAGWFGLWCANIAEQELINVQGLAFPIGTLVHGMITAHAHVRKMYELALGFVSTFLFCLLQDGLYIFHGVIPKSLTFFTQTTFGIFTVPTVCFDLWPMVWSIGFITGHLIMIPLAVGALSRIFILNPVHIQWFTTLSTMDFVLAFCSGMVVATTVYGVWKSTKKCMYARTNTAGGIRVLFNSVKNNNAWLKEGLLLLVSLCVLLWYFTIPILVQIHLIVFGAICTYQMAVIAGKMGIAPLGRFATFVMAPAMVLFTRDVWHLTFISVFVAACGGVAVDVLFGRKLAQLSGVSLRDIKKYQYFGLVISALVVGFVFVALVRTIPLGSAQLFAHKAQARALLFECAQFNIIVVLLGALFGLGLQYYTCNPMLVLGGILMPLNLSLGLITGGIIAYMVPKAKQWEALASGVFAANSMWMVLRAFLG